MQIYIKSEALIFTCLTFVYTVRMYDAYFAVKVMNKIKALM